MCGPKAIVFSETFLFLKKYQIIPDKEETNKIKGKLQIPKNRDRLDINIISPQPKESFFNIQSAKNLIADNTARHIKKETNPRPKEVK